MKDTEFAIVLRAGRAVLSKGEEPHTGNMIRNPEIPEANLSVSSRPSLRNGILRFHLGAELSCCCQAFVIFPVGGLKTQHFYSNFCKSFWKGKSKWALSANRKASGFSKHITLKWNSVANNGVMVLIFFFMCTFLFWIC